MYMFACIVHLHAHVVHTCTYSRYMYLYVQHIHTSHLFMHIQLNYSLNCFIVHCIYLYNKQKFMHLIIFIHTCIHTYICTYIHTYTHTYIHTYTVTHPHIHMHTHATYKQTNKQHMDTVLRNLQFIHSLCSCMTLCT